MKSTSTIVLIVLAAGTALAAPSNGLFRVTADRVNLRARPVKDAEVMAQLGAGAVLDIRGVEGEWARATVPSNVGVWVSAPFVKEGHVTADRLLARGGPGATFREVGVFLRGDAIAELERHGDWIKCRAPGDACVWVSAAFLTPCVPPAPAGPAPVTTPPASTVTGATDLVVAGASGPGSVALPPGLVREELAAELAQGSVSEREGTVDRVPLAFLHCASYRLVALENGRLVTVCYLRGNDEQMPGLVGRRLSVRGREFRLKAERAPLLFPDEIKPLPDAPAIR